MANQLRLATDGIYLRRISRLGFERLDPRDYCLDDLKVSYRFLIVRLSSTMLS